MKPYYMLFFAFLLFGCSSPIQKEPVFTNDITEGPKPWTNEVFEPTEEDFTFAIVSDLAGGERKGIFKVAVEQINRLDPTFVISVGDFIEGGTEDSLQLYKEWDIFDAEVAHLDMPFFYLGGNHDLTNSVMRRVWHHRYGPDYYHFVYNNVLFLMLSTEDFGEDRLQEINIARNEALKILRGEVEGKFEETPYANMIESSTGAMSDAQFTYFKNILAQYPDVKWTFVIMHKPLWLREDELGFSRMEKILQDRPYTVINGHKHKFSHRIRNNRDYIMLGTTGGFQDDQNPASFDHISLVRMARENPVITHIRLDGILDETGMIPAGGDSLSFQASKCK